MNPLANCFRLANIAFLLTALPATVIADPKGLIIYKSFVGLDDSQAKAVEYESVEKFSQVVNFTADGSVSSSRLMRENVMEIVEYPDFGSATITLDSQIEELRATLTKWGALAERFPYSKDQLGKAAAEVREVVEKYEAGNVLLAGRWTPKGDMNKPAPTASPQSSDEVIAELTVTGEDGVSKTFRNVKILKVESDGIRILHSSGTAQIPKANLPEELVATLSFPEPEVAMAGEHSPGMAEGPPGKSKVQDSPDPEPKKKLVNLDPANVGLVKKIAVEAATKEIVRNHLRAPATARFSKFSILTWAEGGFFQTIITVDAQNGFGALVRSHQVCAFRLHDDGTFTYSRSFGCMSVEDGRAVADTMVRKALLEGQLEAMDWPVEE